MSEGRSIAIRYVVLVAANLMSAVLGFAVASLIARQFGAAAFGGVSLALSIVMYAIIVANCGTEIYAVKTVAGDRSLMPQMLSTVILMRFVCGLVVYGIVLAVAVLVPQFVEIKFLIALFGLSVFVSAFNISWVPQAIHRTNAYALANLGAQAVYFVVFCLSLAFVNDLVVVPIAKIVGETVVAIGLFYWLFYCVDGMRPAWPTLKLAGIIRDSAPIGGTQLLRGVALGSDLIILGLFVSKAALGHYAAAFRIFMVLLSFGTAYFVILLPRMAGHRNDKLAMSAELSRSLRRVVPLSIAGLVVLTFLSPKILNLLFGPSFENAAPSLQILCVALFVNILLRHYRQVLLSRELQGLDFKLSIVSGIVHVVAKVIFIPSLGIIGAALGTLVGEFALLVMQWRAATSTLAASLDSSSKEAAAKVGLILETVK